MARSILVTGGNRGIGLAIAKRFAESGDNVAVTYRTGEPPEGGLFGVQCDVTDTEQVEQAFKAVAEHQGPVEVLVSCAGVTRDQLLMRMSEEDFTSVVDANLTGAYRVVKAASKPMLRARKGRVILIASASALYGAAGQSNYAASKAGLIGFARSLARELGSRSITVNVISPGLTDTDMARQLSGAQRDAILQQVPLGRIGQTEEIAAAVEFLASDSAAYITGAVIPVDGGAAMGH
ncbi:3-oxoacyl-ACP reductase FabG [Streptomyces sp. H10-C2]|uniref:3-oxoacyl-ACP reductase FabG n=1 Tax=unclassified Streptomyces TaxID=2593676 RepID=UPI0024B89FB1|nr:MULTISPECIES: 3-oxoacyl-ACP reductase FabG [unclassified Streptomyces]MDJ0344818.1 3-oxoacyl-ACP reductase FabG [Streptomyces sp. PH10-H1]MDJ0369703.1 3-oxoacyl-ACP reductase FabG [Streptomyces sp. H10-C2]